ncbi:glycosyltransferase family 39 protein [Streptomyces olindensis]|uniref:Glycosyltransferase family 39 protein n=1 Tax=Streptomyces olindensis TaxID=358823 RepID=A0ABV2XP03_9ACTN
MASARNRIAAPTGRKLRRAGNARRRPRCWASQHCCTPGVWATPRSSWRAFFFGGLDTSGSITLDKLPGAFWPDAVSVWIFGPHTWAAALPHVIEGVLTVWLLHRIVRAWAGPFAALIASLTLTFTPVTVVPTR